MVRRRRFLVPDIEAGTGNALVTERLEQGGLIVNEAARSGNEKGMWLHQRKLARADHAAIVLAQRATDRDEVRAAHQFVEFDLLPAPRSDFLRGEIGIVRNHLHVQEALAEFGDAAADIADPDNANGLALRLVADQRVAIDIGFAPQRAIGFEDAL